MDLRLFAHSVLMVTEKDMRIYYYKGSVVIFGLLFPFIMFLTFFIGRNLDVVLFFPSFLGMMLFFSASSTGPLITPWEKRERTFERLVSLPVLIESICTWGYPLRCNIRHGNYYDCLARGYRNPAPAPRKPADASPCTPAGLADLCIPWHPACFAGNRDAFEHHDVLEPRPAPAHLRLGHLHPAQPAGDWAWTNESLRSRTLSTCSTQPLPGMRSFRLPWMPGRFSSSSLYLSSLPR